MRSSHITPATLSILGLLAQSQISRATPFPLEYDAVLINRACANVCGFYGQLCCTSSQTCGTNSAGEAVCLAGADSSSQGGGYQMYTTTYVATETDLVTITSTWSSLIASSTAGNLGSCRPTLGETPCGDVCCSASEMCENKVCVEGASSGYWSSFYSATATPPLRPTSSGEATVTQTGAATTTQSFIAPVGTSGASIVGVHAGGSGGLSGGAIAGIVIGVIAGIIFLLLLCACFCFKGALDGLMALLGLGGRRRKETTYVEERYSHHSQGGKPEKRTWFGTRPSRPEGSEKKSSGLGGLATVGLILGALALCLGLKRRKDRDDKSDYTYPSSYYYSDYYTSASSESSDRRTRDTRRSRRSRSRSHR